MIWVAAGEVAREKPPVGRSPARTPRNGASRAQAEPVAPPPITHRSNCRSEMLFSSSSLLFINAPESECDLGPEPQNRGVRQRGIPAYVGVILKCGLPQKVRRHLHRVFQLLSFF